MSRPLYIFSNGTLKRKNNTLYFEQQEHCEYYPIEGTSDIYLYGEVTLNKRLLEFLARAGVTLHLFSRFGSYVGSFYPREKLGGGDILLDQARHYLDSGMRMVLARAFVQGAVANIRKVLLYYRARGRDLAYHLGRIDTLAEGIAACGNPDTLMAVEGNIRESYYAAFDLILDDPDFMFGRRSRMPPENRLNALISFGNSLLYGLVLTETYNTRLDPRIAYLHSSNERKASLNLDVAEIFKPLLVDRVIFTLVNKRMLKADSFKPVRGGVHLSAEGRLAFIRQFERNLRSMLQVSSNEKRISYRRLVREELYKLVRHLSGIAPYSPFVSGW